jgi:adenosylmethionine-8-amino-7-oxononanoate aminotransferase
MRNLDIMQSEKINEHVREKESVFRKTLEKLYDIPIVGNIRGEGFFYGIELVKDKETRESFSAQESERILRGFISQALFENGIYCRTDDRGDPVVQLAPALIANETQFDEIESILRKVLSAANSMV